MRIITPFIAVLALVGAAAAAGEPGPNAPGARIAGAVSTTVTRSGGEWSYTYILSVDAKSPESLSSFAIKYSPDLDPAIGDTPLGWLSNSRVGDDALAAWVALSRGLVAPGGSVGGLTIRAGGLPGIVDGFVEGFVPPSQLPVFEADAVPENVPGTDLTTIGRRVRVVGPVPPPASNDPLVLLAGIVALKKEAVSLGWIDRSWSTTRLEVHLGLAAARLSRGDTPAARSHLQAALQELATPGSTRLDPAAVTLLTSNIEYLLGTL